MTSRRPWLAALALSGLALAAPTSSPLVTPQSPAPPWWLTEPIRFLQTNLSERDSVVDPAALVAAVHDTGANTFLVNMGGIVAQYPTRAPFHYPSAFLPAGRDLFGDVLREAHARKIRVIGRFDLSKTQKAVYDAHPEWFFRRATGEPAIYNGLYSTCINGDYYRRHALTILTEALERYEVDGLFFNMFGNPATDYSGVAMGPCACDACRVRLRARTGRDVPAQADRTAIAAAAPVFAWHAQHEDLYVGQRNAARVLLLAIGDTPAYRGFFRLLTEQHIPFEVATHVRGLAADPGRFDLVVVPGAMPDGVDAYVRGGGRVLVAGTSPPAALPIGRIVRTSKTQGYWRIHDRARLPSLAATDLLFVDGDYVELAPVDPPVLTLIPTAMFGPPEKVWSDKTETTVPGLVVAPHGKGRAAYIPWDVGGLYYRHSSPAHAALMTDVIDQLLPAGRQLRTSAHPLVEMTLMTQPARGRTLVHLVNGSGHHDTAYFAPIAMRDIRVELPGRVRRVQAVALGRELPITSAGGASVVTLPRLDAYEVLTIER